MFWVSSGSSLFPRGKKKTILKLAPKPLLERTHRLFSFSLFHSLRHLAEKTRPAQRDDRKNVFKFMSSSALSLLGIRPRVSPQHPGRQAGFGSPWRN